jgi:hypothetical protein
MDHWIPSVTLVVVIYIAITLHRTEERLMSLYRLVLKHHEPALYEEIKGKGD